MTETPWVLVTDRAPIRGDLVDLSRDGKTKLDTLYWYPDIGNWEVAGLYWRPASR